MAGTHYFEYSRCSFDPLAAEHGAPFLNLATFALARETSSQGCLSHGRNIEHKLETYTIPHLGPAGFLVFSVKSVSEHMGEGAVTRPATFSN